MRGDNMQGSKVFKNLHKKLKKLYRKVATRFGSTYRSRRTRREHYDPRQEG